ncbi:MAG: SMEK domain-containing protein [Chloroflexi bacterium]|nr:SMEK domain-containing protein [Chloroflexota bacterium]
MQRTDINKVSENILIPIFSEVYGYRNLRNLNYSESENHPSVDLGDDVARVSIQVTSTSTSLKIKETLKGFIEHELYRKYDRVIVYILTEKQKTYSANIFNDITQGKVVFDVDKDIFDYRDLLREIGNLQADATQRVLHILETHFGDDRTLDAPRSEIERSNTIVVRYAKGDKDFGLWLSLQLASQGYPVWCDLLNTEPGAYAPAMVEDLVRNEAGKYLFVLSGSSNDNSELLKELRLAYETAQSRKLVGLVIPVQVTDIPEDERTILLQGTSPIDFSRGWSTGLNDLLKYLEKSGLPKDEKFTPSKANDLWRMQFHADKGLIYEPEELLSNWFPIDLPVVLFFHELQRNGIGLLAIQEAVLPFPAIQHNIHLISFAKAEDFLGKLGKDIFIRSTVDIKLQDFLDGNYEQKLAKKDLAWNFVTELLNDAWDRFFSQTKLKKYALANNHLCYYFPIGFSDKGDNKAFFQGVAGKRTWRSLAGKHKGQFWHFGIQGRAMLYPEPAFLVKYHGLASGDGFSIWGSKEKLHTARRRWFKSWWNPEWRDRLVAAMAYLSGEKESFKISLGSDAVISVSSSPLVFRSPATYINPRDTVTEAETEIEADDEDLPDDEEFDETLDDTSEEVDL